MLSENYAKAVRTLNDAFYKIDREIFESYFQKNVNEGARVLVTIQTRGKHQAYGWCSTAELWRDEEGGAYEINLSAEFTDRPLSDTLQTLIHEMVHLKNIMEKIQDCSRKGTYHNKRFKAGAEAVGLEVEESKKYGWAHTKLSDALLVRLQAMFEELDHPMAIARKEISGMKAKAKKKEQYQYTCPTCGITFKAAVNANLTCTDCEEEMDKEEVK